MVRIAFGKICGIVLVGMMLFVSAPSVWAEDAVNAHRMRVLLVGDSLARAMAPGFQEGVLDKRIADLHLSVRPGSGYNHPEAFNWKRRLLRAASDTSPDMVVIALGGADEIALPTSPGFALDFGTAAWKREYEYRVLHLVGAVHLGAPHARVLLVGVAGAGCGDPRNLVLRKIGNDLDYVSFQPAPALLTAFDGRLLGRRCLERVVPEPAHMAADRDSSSEKALRVSALLSLFSNEYGE